METVDTFTKNLRDAGRKAWLAGLGTIAVAEEETRKRYDAFVKETERTFDRLVERGKKFGEKGPEQLEEVIDDVREDVGEAAGEVREGVASVVDRAEDTIRTTVEGLLHLLGIPTQDEVAALNRRVKRLNTKARKATK